MPGFKKVDRLTTHAKGSWTQVRLTVWVQGDKSSTPLSEVSAMLTEDFRELAGLPDPPETVYIDAPMLEIINSYVVGEMKDEQSKPA